MSLTDDTSFATPNAIQEAARAAEQRVRETIATPVPVHRSIAQRIFDADDVTSQMLEVPEWGVTLELRSPTGEERSDLQKAFVDMEASQRHGELIMRDMKAMWPAIVITCCYDPDTGERAFTMDPATMAALNRKNGAVLERVATACLPIVGLTPGDVEEKKESSPTTPSPENPSS